MEKLKQSKHSFTDIVEICVERIVAHSDRGARAICYMEINVDLCLEG